jgi:polyisoprenoid-binding protein YceI
MRTRRAITLLLLALGAAAIGYSAGDCAQAHETTFRGDISASRLEVSGTSTLHHWEVQTEDISGSVTFQTQTAGDLQQVLQAFLQNQLTARGEVRIPVESLKSGKASMDGRMYTALENKKNPEVIFVMESAECSPNTGDIHTVHTKGTLNIAGTVKTVEIPMRLELLSSNRIRVTGQFTTRMTDFNIHPPRAMFGTIKTGDEISITWVWEAGP